VTGDRAREVAGTEIRAAGAVLYRTPGPRSGGGIEVAVIHRPDHDDWAFPKGKLEPGEHVLAAAVREVTEETGIRPVLGRPLAAVHYQAYGRPKRVDYWAARADREQDPGFVPGSEVDMLDWLAPEAATSRLSYAHDVGLLDRLVSAVGDGAEAGGDTVPCVLLRHASAVRKDAWAGDDLLRPLTESGQAQAAALSGLLGCFAPSRVISSPALRCLDTVRPYAASLGATVEQEPAFAVGTGQAAGQAEQRGEASRRMAELIGQGLPTVVCGHRENLGILLDAAIGWLGGQRPGDDWSPPKGGFWVLHQAGGRLAALEHHDLSGS
jgi:8-oxo-(d)GTP phosphatase